jgi:hypothetical protein
MAFKKKSEEKSAITYPELTVETDDNDHIDEITEEHWCIDITNEERLLQLSIESDNRLHKVGIA